MMREINGIANSHHPSQFSLDGLLINGLEVRVLPGSPLIPKDLRSISLAGVFLIVGTFVGSPSRNSCPLGLCIVVTAPARSLLDGDRTDGIPATPKKENTLVRSTEGPHKL